MMLSKESLATRRDHLSKQIARQRVEFAEAYRDLGRPLHYAQRGIKGVQMVRENAWLVGLAPAVVSLVFSFLGWKKQEKSRPKWFGFGKRKPKVRDEAEEEEGHLSRRARPFLAKWLGHGVSAFKIYRRVRPYIPL